MRGFFLWLNAGKRKNVETKKPALKKTGFIMWSHLGSNQGPPDYESGALTN